jgi:hypothetical protein
VSPGFAVNFIVLVGAAGIICGVGEGEKDGWIGKLACWAILITANAARWLP